MLLFPPVFVIVTVEGDYSSPLFPNGGENCCIDNTDDHNRNYDKDTQKNVRVGPVPLFHYMRRLIVGPNVPYGGETERANPNRGQNAPNFLSRHLGLVFEWLKYSQLSVIRDREKIKRGAQKTDIFSAFKNPTKLANAIPATSAKRRISRGDCYRHENIANCQAKQKKVHIAASKVFKAKKSRASNSVSGQNNNTDDAVDDPKEEI